jgi:ABC-type Zn uptake system ZnuABC Zn-binding protein ZnuA
VVASIFPVADLASFMGGGAVRVEALLPPRASPSSFEPTARQMARLSGAAVYLFVGGGLDAWAEQLVGSDAVVVRLTEGMQLREGHAHEGHAETGNPHVWLDPVRVRDEILPRIEAALERAAPDSASAIRERTLALADSLTTLDGEIRGDLARLPSRAFVSTHSAWVYFAERYGLEEIGAVYESPGREPSARYLAELIEAARGAGARAVFIEPQLGEAGARTVAAELDLEVVLLDPQGGEGQEGREGYLSLMRFNAAQVARALGPPPGGPD